MVMYQVQPEKNKMQLCLSTKFGDHYQENDLENWLAQNPTIQTDGKPLLVMSGHTSTNLDLYPDLIGLDEDGRATCFL